MVGEDVILAEMMKESGVTVLHEQEILYSRCLVEGEIPTYWSNPVVVLVYKTRDQENL